MSTHDFRAGDDPAQRHLFVDPEEIEPEIDRPEGRRYREAPIRAVDLPKPFIEEVGGAFTNLGTIRTELLVAARAAYLLRRSEASSADALLYPERKPGFEKYDFYAEKKEGTLIKSLQGFAEDIWRRVYKKAVPEGKPTDDPEFEAFYDSVRMQIARSSHVNVLGPAVAHPNSLVQDYHGRRIALSDGLEQAAEGHFAPAQPRFVRCRGPEQDETTDLWTYIERVTAQKNDLHRSFSKALTASRLDRRHRTAEGRRFERQHQRDGIDGPSYVSVGRWRPEEIGRTDRPSCAVRVPWIIADIDPPFGKGRYWCARQARVLLCLLRERGVDLSDVVVSYSGNSSIHVRLPDGFIGCPLYQNAQAAAKTIQQLFGRLCKGNETLLAAVDGNLFHPGHLIRVIGSVHPRTGRRVVGTDGRTFLRKPSEFLFYHAERDFQYSPPKRYPLPRRASFTKGLSQLLKPGREDANPPRQAGSQEGGEDKGVRQSRSGYGRGSAGGTDCRLVLDRVRPGVAEGEDWGTDIDPRYVGRNWAALFVAHEQLRQKGEPARAWRAVRDWNRRNEPPLDGDELTGVFEKALRFRERGQS
jgi:hypothetical protein